MSQDMVRKTACVLFLFSVLICLFPSSVFPGEVHEEKYRDRAGTRDFIAYYAASRALLHGKSPYDEQALAGEKPVSHRDRGANVVWNPPWTFLLTAPLAIFDFQAAVRIWIVTDILCLLLTVGLVRPFLPEGKIRLIPCFLGFLLSPAVHEAVWFGQLSVFLALVWAGTLYSILREKEWVSGIFLFFCTIKLHLFYLPAVFIVMWMMKKRKWKTAGGFAVSGMVSIAIVWVLSPAALLSWLHSPPRPMHNMASTLVTPVRLIMAHWQGYVPSWPVAAVPMIAVFSLIYWSWRNKRWTVTFSRLTAILAISLFTAPYGWFFDFAALFAAQIVLMHQIFDSQFPPRARLQILALSVSVLLASTLPAVFGATGQHLYFWYPPAFLGIWLLTEREALCLKTHVTQIMEG